MYFSSASGHFAKIGLIHRLLLGTLVLACIIASIHPLNFESYLLHQVGTVLGVVLLLFLQLKRQVSLMGFALTIAFILLHILGAHYLYSYVPYNDWIKSWVGVDLNQYFGWSRNMYDRLIHFSYGLLLFKICCDVFSAWLPSAKPLQIVVLAIQFIMASSMVYELIEWWIAVGMSPQAAENYNGQQGDIWDAQKDMALATLGALCAALIQRFYLWFK